MTEKNHLDDTFQIILKYFLDTGRAPHYTEIASDWNVPVEEARKAVHDLFSPGFPGWLYPNTDYICSFPPFNNLPTQYHISVDGEQKWFAQGGFESLAVSWLFPGKLVKIDARCLDCAKPVKVEMKDGKILNLEPGTLMGYVSVPFRNWFNDLPYAGSTMNLFRSEEHIRNWRGFKPGTEEGINKPSDIAELFSLDFFTRRPDPDYASHMEEYMAEFAGTLKAMGSFWQPPEGEKINPNSRLRVPYITEQRGIVCTKFRAAGTHDDHRE